MNLKLEIIALLSLMMAHTALAQTVPLCFANKGLKDDERIHFTREADRISGEWLIDRDYDTGRKERYPFAGRQQGDTLIIAFTNKQPDGTPPNRASFSWRVESRGLKVERYGRNHVTQAWSAYIADYESCEPDHATLMRTAKRIGFARGASSAAVSVTLEAATARKAFVLNLGKGQGASVDAPGCGISFYYPDKKRHDETAIDRLNIAALPQGGDYIFVLSPAGAPGRCEATFSAR